MSLTQFGELGDSIVVDFRELQLKWAVDDIAQEVGELMDYLERQADLEGFEHFSKTIAAINNYNKLIAAHQEGNK